MDSHTDEHDLAKALDSVAAELSAKAAARDQANDAPANDAPVSDLSTPAPSTQVTPTPDPAPAPSHPYLSSISPAADESAESPSPPPYLGPTDTNAGELESIKKDVIFELRPLVDKLTVSPEEKFDTYLLLIRSTDDKALIAPAHEAAKAITDEARRAEALLDIIKEIDYLSNQK